MSVKCDVFLYPTNGAGSHEYLNVQNIDFSSIPMLVFDADDGDHIATTLPFWVRTKSK